MKTVLVAEDNAVNRELITQMLEVMDWRVLQAVDGQHALEILSAQMPDVALIDLQMPRLDGRETIRRIRDHPQWRHLPVIACTAFAMQGDREEILSHGFDGYLSKPISMAELVAVLRQVQPESAAVAKGSETSEPR